MKTKSLLTIAAFATDIFDNNITRWKNKTSPIRNDSILIKDEALTNSLILRLEEIKQIDKTKLQPSEKELRKEVRTIKSQLKEIDGGVYISVGALILILILLIVLL